MHSLKKRKEKKKRKKSPLHEIFFSSKLSNIHMSMLYPSPACHSKFWRFVTEHNNQFTDVLSIYSFIYPYILNTTVDICDFQTSTCHETNKDTSKTRLHKIKVFQTQNCLKLKKKKNLI